MKTNKTTTNNRATDVDSVFNRLSQDGKTPIGEVIRRSVIENSKNDYSGQKCDTPVSQADIATSACGYQLTPQAEAGLKKLLKAASSTVVLGNGLELQKPDAAALLKGTFDRDSNGHVGSRGQKVITQLNKLAADACATNGLLGPCGPEATALLNEFVNRDSGEQNTGNQPYDENLTILDVCDRLMCDYKPYNTPTMSDLVANLGEEEACYYLGKVVGAKVAYLADRTFCWKEETKYAPRNISFKVHGAFALQHDEEGIVTHPFRLMDARPIMPYLPTELATRESDEIQFCVGTAECGRNNAVFATTDLKRDILLSVHWGGSRNRVPQTGLQPTEDTCEIVKFSERVSSQRGGEGYDFYIIDITEKTPLRTAVEMCLAERIQTTSASVRLFAQKYDLRERLNAAYADYIYRYNELVDFAQEQLGRIKNNECFENYFVALPEFLVELPDKIEPTFDFRWDFQELQKLCLRVECTTFKTLKANMEESLEAWEEFAPKYTKLYKPVVKVCHGKILIKGDKAIITIVSRDKFEGAHQKPPKMEFEYAFNEVELGHCLNMVSERVAYEQESKAKNQELMEKLLAE